MPLDDFLVAWDNVALLMRRRLEEQPAWAPTHATTAHRSFHFVEPEAGGIRLESGETPCKYTVYLIDTSGCMLVGDVTV